MEHGAKPHLKHLTEYFALLYEFSKMGEDESQFLISIHAISTMVNFYLGQKSVDYVSQLFLFWTPCKYFLVLNLVWTIQLLILGYQFKNGINLLENSLHQNC